jgi:opacity protein-like surface antigen
MGNLSVGIPTGGQAGAGFRPYATIGFGVIQTNVDDPGGLFDLQNNETGINIGGGAMVFFSDHIGVRGDIRYFRNLTDPEGGNGFDLDLGGFDFWRGTAGVVFRF